MHTTNHSMGNLNTNSQTRDNLNTTN